MLPRAASRPVPGACHPRSSLRCPRSSRRHACWPASADKQPAWQMCMPPVRGSGSDLAHAPGSAGHVCTCHVQLWWQRPAAALTERRMRHQVAVACHPPALAPDDGTRRNDSPGTGCNNSVVDPALCLHYLHAVKAGRPWLTGGLSWPVMESTRARARDTCASLSARHGPATDAQRVWLSPGQTSCLPVLVR